ncbi:hypothetical protein NEUTE2DRAFT_110594 [Neurospora tetrasperma FGSC 2509]|nr:hypothetical protein NEUTE2DRAFT_110594 [Neurospora tetrasperma FGSC 2509]
MSMEWLTPSGFTPDDASPPAGALLRRTDASALQAQATLWLWRTEDCGAKSDVQGVPAAKNHDQAKNCKKKKLHSLVLRFDFVDLLATCHHRYVLLLIIFRSRSHPIALDLCTSQEKHPPRALAGDPKLTSLACVFLLTGKRGV